MPTDARKPLKIDANGLELCRDCHRALAWDGEHAECVCDDKVNKLAAAKVRRATRYAQARRAGGDALSDAQAEARSRSDFEKRQMSLPNLPPAPKVPSWWRS